jgi:hypothetical protein
MPPAAKRPRKSAAQQPPSKKSKPTEDPVLTADELRLLIPADLKEYVRTSPDATVYLQRLQTLFAFMFHRLVYYPGPTLQNILGIVRPASFRPSPRHQTEAATLFNQLLGDISKMHMRITTHFLEDTEYGRNYWRLLSTARNRKTRLPPIDAQDVMVNLDLPALALRCLWYPLAITGESAQWEPNKCPDDEEWEIEADADTPTLAHFRSITAEIVVRFVKLWQKNQAELTSHVQIAIFKELSSRMLEGEWPMFNVSGKHLTEFRPGVYIPAKIYDFFDKCVQREAERFKQRADALDESQLIAEDSQADERGAENDLEKQAEAADNAAADNAADVTDMQAENDPDEADIDQEIEDQIDDALLDTKVVGRPVLFGSEFPETGGSGIGAKSLTEIMELNEESRTRVIEVLQETGDSLMGHHYSAEEAETIGAMGARATALYGKLRLERENRAIEDAIWRFQAILDENELEILDLDGRIGREIEKQKYFNDMEAKIDTSYAAIDEKQEKLNQLTGKVDDEAEDTSKKGTWKDRKKALQQNAQKGVGMQWRYTPGAKGKGKQVERTPSRMQTPAAPSVPPRGPVTPHKPAAGPSASQASSFSFPIEGDDTAEGSGAGEDKMHG